MKTPSERYQLTDHQLFYPPDFVSSLRASEEVLRDVEVNLIGARNKKSRYDAWLRNAVSNLYKLLSKVSGRPSLMLVNAHDRYQPASHVLHDLIASGYVTSADFSYVRYNDLPTFPMYMVNHQYLPGQTDGIELAKSFSNGLAESPEAAIGQGIGEFIERYFLTLYHNKNLLKGSVTALRANKTPFVHPSKFAGFSDEQRSSNALYAFNDQSVFSWERCLALGTGKRVYIPAQLVYWTYQLQPHEPMIREMTTNGAGCMDSLEGAILVGLYELIQRDGYLIHWHNKLSPDRIDNDSIPFPKFQTLRAQAEKYHFDVHVLNFTSDVQIPTFGVLLQDRTGKFPLRAMGLSAHADAERAIANAFHEAWSINFWLRRIGRGEGVLNVTAPFQDSRIDQLCRMQLFGAPEYEAHYRFLLEGAEKQYESVAAHFYKPVSQEPAATLQEVSKYLQSFGSDYSIYYFAAESPFLKKHQFHSVQTLVPALIPIHLVETYPHFGGNRLKCVPEKLGRKAAKVWNPIPHPFP